MKFLKPAAFTASAIFAMTSCTDKPRVELETYTVEPTSMSEVVTPRAPWNRSLPWMSVPRLPA